MKVILTENLEKLGQAGEVKEVANGYARNYLFPRNLAIPATKGAVQDVANRRATAARRASSQVNAAQSQADRLRGLSVLLYARTGEQNRLYGSITSADVAEALRVQHGQTIDRRRIKIDAPIHRTGTFTATVTVGQNLTAPLTLIVAPETTRGASLTSVAPAAPAPPAPPAPAVTEAAAGGPAETTASTVAATPAVADATAPVEAPATLAAADATAPVEAPAATEAPHLAEMPAAGEPEAATAEPLSAGLAEASAGLAEASARPYVPETTTAPTVAGAATALEPAAETVAAAAPVATAEQAGAMTFAPADVDAEGPPSAAATMVEEA